MDVCLDWVLVIQCRGPYVRLPHLEYTIFVQFDASRAQLPRGLANQMPRQGVPYLN